MDPVVSGIVGALVAGATAAASETATQAVRDAYNALKAVLVDTYKLASTALLEKKPSSAAYHEAVQDELKDHPAVASDTVVLERAQAVREALSQMPPETVRALGIDLEFLKASGNIIAERIRGGIRGKEWSAGGDARFSDIDGGLSPAEKK